MTTQSNTNRVIGHIIGLTHEYQRPDARKMLRFDCRALYHYPQAETRVASIDPSNEPAFKNLSLEERMNLVLVLSSLCACLRTLLLKLIPSCRSDDLAQKYFPQVLAYLPRDEQVPRLRTSEKFDYKSIMIYNSYFGRALNTQRWPLLTAEGELIHNGGNKDPNLQVLHLWISSASRLCTQGFAYQRKRLLQPLKPLQDGRESKLQNVGTSIPFDKDAGPAHSKSWPASLCDSRSYIPFCYADQASQDSLKDLFTEGLAKWAQVLYQSSLVFAPDVACGPNGVEHCLCSTGGISEETVHIMLARQGETWPLSTLGHTAPSFPKKHPDMPRHFIQ